MKLCLALIAAGSLGACAGADPDVRVERQSSTLAAASDGGWTAGGGVVVGGPDTFEFPQPLALRISLVDSNADLPEPADGEAAPAPELLPISRAILEAYEAGPFEVVQEPVCQSTYCEAELRILEPGRSMLEVVLTGGDGDEADCFYFAVYEDADPAAVSATLRDEAEAAQAACRQALIGG